MNISKQYLDGNLFLWKYDPQIKFEFNPRNACYASEQLDNWFPYRYIYEVDLTRGVNDQEKKLKAIAQEGNGLFTFWIETHEFQPKYYFVFENEEDLIYFTLKV